MNKKTCNSLDFKMYVAVILFMPIAAHAYVDPGSGSALVTTILGLIAAVAYTFRKYFYKVKNLFFGKKPEEEEKPAN